VSTRQIPSTRTRRSLLCEPRECNGCVEWGVVGVSKPDAHPEPVTGTLKCREAMPSFALLDIQGPIVVTYVYQLVDGEVRVEKVEYRCVLISRS